MATDNERIEFQRSAVPLKPVAFPKFPKFSQRIKNKFPDLLPEFAQYDADTKQFVIELQNILRFGDSSPQLQPIATTTVIFPPPPATPPTGTGVQGPRGQQGFQGLQGPQGDSIIVTPPAEDDDEALMLATLGA